MGKSKEDVRLIFAFRKIKVGTNLNFKVLEIGEEFTHCQCVEHPEFYGAVYYEKLGRGYYVNPHDHFEIGDVFEGRVYQKDINRTFRILPTLNLAEQKRIKVKQQELESWKNGE